MSSKQRQECCVFTLFVLKNIDSLLGKKSNRQNFGASSKKNSSPNLCAMIEMCNFVVYCGYTICNVQTRNVEI